MIFEIWKTHSKCNIFSFSLVWEPFLGQNCFSCHFNVTFTVLKYLSKVSSSQVSGEGICLLALLILLYIIYCDKFCIDRGKAHLHGSAVFSCSLHFIYLLGYFKNTRGFPWVSYLLLVAILTFLCALISHPIFHKIYSEMFQKLQIVSDIPVSQ